MIFHLTTWHIIDKFDPSHVYDTDTNENDIKNDILVKYIIINSLGEETKKILVIQGKTAYQVFDLPNNSFTLGPEYKNI